MSFKAFEVTVIKKLWVGTGCGVALRKGKASGAGMRATLNLAVAESCGIVPDISLQLQLGGGTDHGIIRLVPGLKGQTGLVLPVFRAVGAGKGYCLLALGHIPLFVDRAEKKQWCQWEQVERGGIEIVLPGWAEETAPRKEKIAAPIVRDGKIISPQAARVRARLDAEDTVRARETLKKNEQNIPIHERGSQAK